VVSATHLDQLLLLGFELFELLPDAILVVDGRGIIRYANRQAGRLFGQEPTTLVSAPIEALLPEHLRERHIGHRTKYTSSEPHMRPMGTGLDLAGRRADGTTFPVDIMLNPLKHLAEPMVLAVVRDVTDRRVAEETLHKSRAMFETLYEHSPDAVFVVDEIGKIDRVNAQAEALFRLPRERLLGRPIEMLLPERFRDRHLAHRASYLKDAKIRPMGSGLDLWAQRGDGSEFPVDIMLSPIEIGQRRLALAVVRDITERRVAEEALHQSRTMFEKFYEQSPDAIIVVDEIGRIDHVNALAEALFGLSRERMVGQSIEMLLPKRFHDRHSAHRTGYMKDAKMRPMGTGLPLFAQRADGSEFPVDIMLSPIEIEQRRMVLAVVRDITERKRAEAQVELLMNEVNHRAKNLLGVVQALAHQTDATSSQEFISRFDERIQSLSSSHDLLVKSKWRNVSFAELVRAQLAHFGGLLGSRIAVRGPDLWITSAAAQVIGMALDELATNAAKYGALSTAIGCVEIVWGLKEDGAGGNRFTMEWSESGGPTVVTPTRRGFGWTVLCQMTEASLEGDVTLKYAPTGVVWHFECPADRVTEDEATRESKLAEHGRST
jgi:PAS domain S-box-containing protein